MAEGPPKVGVAPGEGVEDGATLGVGESGSGVEVAVLESVGEIAGPEVSVTEGVAIATVELGVGAARVGVSVKGTSVGVTEGVGVTLGSEHPLSEARTASTSSSTVTRSSRFESAARQRSTREFSRAMLTASTSSSTVTTPPPSQSPVQPAMSAALEAHRDASTASAARRVRLRVFPKAPIIDPLSTTHGRGAADPIAWL